MNLQPSNTRQCQSTHHRPEMLIAPGQAVQPRKAARRWRRAGPRLCCSGLAARWAAVDQSPNLVWLRRRGWGASGPRAKLGLTGRVPWCTIAANGRRGSLTSDGYAGFGALGPPRHWAAAPMPRHRCRARLPPVAFYLPAAAKWGTATAAWTASFCVPQASGARSARSPRTLTTRRATRACPWRRRASGRRRRRPGECAQLCRRPPGLLGRLPGPPIAASTALNRADAGSAVQQALQSRHSLPPPPLPPPPDARCCRLSHTASTLLTPAAAAAARRRAAGRSRRASGPRSGAVDALLLQMTKRTTKTLMRRPVRC